MTAPSEARYDRGTIYFHWLTALLVVGLWIIGQTADYLPKGPGRSAYWSLHVSGGFLLIAVYLGRLIWRLTRGRRLPDADRGALNVIAKSTHHLLYVLLLIVLALGVANAFVRGYHLFGLFALPQLGNPDWKRPINELHELGANILLGLAAIHAAAALWHQFIRRDRLLLRMMPERT